MPAPQDSRASCTQAILGNGSGVDYALQALSPAELIWLQVHKLIKLQVHKLQLAVPRWLMSVLLEPAQGGRPSCRLVADMPLAPTCRGAPQP